MQKEWTSFYRENNQIAYPAEGVIRIFKGKFPNLDLSNLKPGTKVLDLGAGDGRHLAFFEKLGFDCHGVEISQEICNGLQNKLKNLNIIAEIREGLASDIPYSNHFFDVLLAWNSCYYMQDALTDFQEHVQEMARPLKPGGLLVCSVPQPSSFIFKDADYTDTQQHYKTVKDDFFGLRNGQVMRCLKDKADIEHTFSPHFTNFRHATISLDWFGLSYDWYVFVAEKK